jgi:DNA-binding transcriptional ArsR family regulator
MARAKSKKAAAVVKKAAAVPKSTKTPVAPVKAPRKKRVGNVRALILKALGSGAKTRPVLQKSSGASYNALVMHLSKLRDEGIVETDSSNRLISLAAAKTATATATANTETAAKVKAAPAPKTATPANTLPQLASETAQVAGYSPRVLNEALDALASRFKPIPALDEKLLVLDQLTVQIGGPIGHVLASIKADLLVLSTR